MRVCVCVHVRVYVRRGLVTATGRPQAGATDDGLSRAGGVENVMYAQ